MSQEIDTLKTELNVTIPEFSKDVAELKLRSEETKREQREADSDISPK